MGIQEQIRERLWGGKQKSPALTLYLREDRVVFLETSTQEESLRRLVEMLDRSNTLPDRELFYGALLKREQIVSTGIGLGIAVPHAKLHGYSDFFIAVGIQKQGVEWAALDGAPVRLIFMIGGPDNRQTEYLTILSRLTMVVKEEERRKALLRATTAQEVLQVFAGY